MFARIASLYPHRDLGDRRVICMDLAKRPDHYCEFVLDTKANVTLMDTKANDSNYPVRPPSFQGKLPFLP